MRLTRDCHMRDALLHMTFERCDTTFLHDGVCVLLGFLENPSRAQSLSAGRVHIPFGTGDNVIIFGENCYDRD